MTPRRDTPFAPPPGCWLNGWADPQTYAWAIYPSSTGVVKAEPIRIRPAPPTHAIVPTYLPIRADSGRLVQLTH